MQQGNPRWLRY